MSETLINEHPQQRWHPFTRTVFRFAFVYLLLYNLPFPLSAFPYVDKAAELYNSLWSWIVPRLARAAFNREVSTVFNGSGDRTYDYLLVACLLLISLVITVIWTFFDRKRLSYPTFPLVAPLRAFLFGDSDDWLRRIQGNQQSVFRISVQTATEGNERFGLQLDQEKRTLTLRKREDPGWNSVLTYEQVSPEVVTLAGKLNGSEMTARLRRSEERKFLLTDRGFHWINEFPLNR